MQVSIKTGHIHKNISIFNASALNILHKCISLSLMQVSYITVHTNIPNFIASLLHEDGGIIKFINSMFNSVR